MNAGHAIVSPRADFAWFVAPGIAALAVALGLGLLDAQPDGAETLGLWIVGVLLVDVAHVYASLYRTYLDPVARRLHRPLLIATPAAVAVVGVVLHLQSAILFWSVLAYVAIFHFIKQHIGFAMLYVRGGRESAGDRRLVHMALWAGTLAPVVWWHSQLPRRFAWFTPDDLITGLPAWLGTAALLVTVPLWVAFVRRRIQLWRAGSPNWMVVWLTLVPAANWYLGIVVFNDDRIFTITNVFLHGVPYFALVWVAGGRACVTENLQRMTGRSTHTVVSVGLAFYAVLLFAAVSEEALWDHLVWHEHSMLFGDIGLRLGPTGVAILSALLTVPQATHYVLDRFIWRAGPTNPALAGQLGLSGGSPPTDAK